MTTNEGRCEPPPEWRDRDGWHWVERRNGRHPSILYWNGLGRWISPGRPAYGPDVLTEEGYRYLAPVTPPATVAALVEALEGMQAAVKDIPQPAAFRLPADLTTRFLRADRQATAALALYRGEAGR